MTEDDPTDEISEIETRIEELAEIAERCRKFILASKAAVAGGVALLLVAMLGLLGSGPSAALGSIAFVQQSGGQVRIYSEVGQGTSVSLYLPRYVGLVDEVLPVQQTEVEGGLGETVLVVDDEATVRMLVSEVLTERFYNILEASDGRSALNHLEAGRRIDLLITDVGLPGGMNGRQVADAARVHRPDLKVLFITGYAENAAIKKWQLEPGMAILRKPFAMATLENKVREMLEG
jgi:CheY-like chemotaxis protein